MEVTAVSLLIKNGTVVNPGKKQNEIADILVENEGNSLSIEAGKAELPAKFAQLLKL